MIQHSIEAAVQSGVFDRIIVSTDSDAIANIAINLGADVPFTRPPELSDDHATTIPVIEHAIRQLETDETNIDYSCCIYAAAPFISAEDLALGLSRLRHDPTAKFCFPVTTYPFPILRSLRMENGYVEMNYPQHQLTRSQDLPEAWHDAGQFYWGTRNAWSSSQGFFSSDSIGLPIDRHRVQDIDTPEDWTRAELMLELLSRDPDV